MDLSTLVRTICTDLMLLGALLIAALGTCPNKALAYPTPVDFDGELMRWDIGPEDGAILYEIESTDPELTSIFQFLVEEAVSRWNEVPNSYFAFVRANDDQVAQVTINLEEELHDAPFSAGYSIFDEYEDSKPEHCSIYIATSQNSGFTGLGKTALHELGHCLGLGHSLIPEAIMSYRLDKNSFNLDLDDEAAISRLYPADGSEPQLPLGCSIAKTNSSPSSLACLALLFLLPLTSLFPACVRSTAKLSREYPPAQ